MARVVLAMSGGVDSSVAAHLLLGQGHDVVGVFMRHGQQSPVACNTTASLASRGGELAARRGGELAASRGGELSASRGVPAPGSPSPTRTPGSSLPILERLDHKQGCCTAADAADARRVADRLGIPFYAIDLNEEFGQIIDYFAAEYLAGRTPNPCVRCNEWIKFGKLFDYADGVGAEVVATGHYARIGEVADGSPTLRRGLDGGKDQSYALFGVRQEFLRRMLLPVGEYEKPAIRRMAGELGLDVAAKRDSQEICFVTRGRYDEFVRGHRPATSDDRSGELVLADGTVVGRHDGVEGFTVGQRKGLGVALGQPRFVIRIEAETRRVVLGTREESACSQLTARDCNWLVDLASLPGRCDVQIRYNGDAAPAAVAVDADGRLHARFDEPRFAVTPGQAAVCYEGDRVLGGGWIA
jgi:tRNA-specific 2-thiouridylase